MTNASSTTSSPAATSPAPADISAASVTASGDPLPSPLSMAKSHTLWDRIALWNTTKTIQDAWHPLPPSQRAQQAAANPQGGEMGDTYLGDVTITNTTTAPPVSAVAPVPPAAPRPNGLSPLMKLVAVGLAASGVGLPASIAAYNLPSILEALKPTPIATPIAPAPVPAPPLPTPPPSIDTDTQYHLDLGPPAGH